jgi:hypothetical protein
MVDNLTSSDESRRGRSGSWSSSSDSSSSDSSSSGSYSSESKTVITKTDESKADEIKVLDEIKVPEPYPKNTENQTEDSYRGLEHGIVYACRQELYGKFKNLETEFGESVA